MFCTFCTIFACFLRISSTLLWEELSCCVPCWCFVITTIAWKFPKWWNCLAPPEMRRARTHRPTWLTKTAWDVIGHHGMWVRIFEFMSTDVYSVAFEKRLQVPRLQWLAGRNQIDLGMSWTIGTWTDPSFCSASAQLLSFCLYHRLGHPLFAPKTSFFF